MWVFAALAVMSFCRCARHAVVKPWGEVSSVRRCAAAKLGNLKTGPMMNRAVSAKTCYPAHCAKRGVLRGAGSVHSFRSRSQNAMVCF